MSATYLLQNLIGCGDDLMTRVPYRCLQPLEIQENPLLYHLLFIVLFLVQKVGGSQIDLE